MTAFAGDKARSDTKALLLNEPEAHTPGLAWLLQRHLTSGRFCYALLAPAKGWQPCSRGARCAGRSRVAKAQAKQWLSRLVDEGVIEKTTRPVRCRPAPRRPVQSSLFG